MDGYQCGCTVVVSDGAVTSLVELGAQAVACHLPFEVVEHFYPHIPEQLQLRIAFWSFPENEEDIRYELHDFKAMCTTVVIVFSLWPPSFLLQQAHI